MTQSKVSEWCEGTEQLVTEAESLSRRLQQVLKPPVGKNLDPDDVHALATTYVKFMQQWQDIPSATRRLQSAGESLAKTGPESLQNRLLGILDALRPTLDNAPDLPQKSGLVLTGWFRSGTGILEGRSPVGGVIPMVTGHVDRLPEGHWLRSILPPDELYRGSVPMLVLGPMVNRQPSPVYPLRWVVSYTRQWRQPQAEEEHRREERERQQQAQAEAVRRNDPELRLRNLTERLERIEAENRELKAKLETKDG